MNLPPKLARKCLDLAGCPPDEPDHQPPKKPKYGNRKTLVDGIVFDSKREAERYLVLKAMEQDGLIRDLRRQVRVPLVVAGVRVCVWVADFVYHDAASGRTEYEDVKGYKTAAYRLKARLFYAVHRQQIRET